jgi:hypothetical protein
VLRHGLLKLKKSLVHRTVLAGELVAFFRGVKAAVNDYRTFNGLNYI